MASTGTLARKQKRRDVTLHAAGNLIWERESVAFGLIIVLILIVRAIVLALGFVSASADEYARTLYGANWAESPFIFEDDSVWQPWHFHLLGLAIKVHYDLLLAPRIVTMVFSLASLGMLYLLTRKLFNRWVALLSTLIVGLLPVHIYLSLTPMVDIVFVTFTISFLYFFFVWLESGADRYLLFAAFMLGVASGMRYDGWFTAAVFSVYLGIRWLIWLWKTRSFRLLWLLAIGLACLPVLVWLLRNFVCWGDPLHFLEGHEGSGYPPRGIGPLTDLFPDLPMVEVLLQNGALICLLAVVGIVLSYGSLRRKLWLYLMFSLTALVVLVVAAGIGRAYRPHYPFPYLVLLTPLCAYALYWAIGESGQSVPLRWQVSGRGMMVAVSLYNLWLVYVRFDGKYSRLLIGLLALAGVVLFYRLLDCRSWLCWTFSLSPLATLMALSKIDLVSAHLLRLGTASYFICLVLFYAYTIWRSRDILEPPSTHQWRAAGLGILVVLCLYNLWGTFHHVPQGMPTSVNKAGLRVRELFEDGTLSDDDKVLFETRGWWHLGMQVMSNRPGNFVFDRAVHSDSESFLLDKDSSPYGTGARFTDYEELVNPFSVDPPLSLREYLNDQQIRLVVVRDPRLEALFGRETEVERIEQVEDYVFYHVRSPN